MKSKINWGIIGCGEIAKQFAYALCANPESILFAVASQTTGKAESFAKDFHVPHFYSNYDDLIRHPDIDVIYIANCNSQHAASVQHCLENRKAVLCEKPLTTRLSDTKRLIEMARANNTFLMEGMWMRFHPAIQKAKSLIEAGVIGKVHMIKADFGYKTSEGILGRQLNCDLGGGATLDVGVYVLHFASLIFKKMPVDLKCSAYIGKTGVDEYAAYLLTYDQGEVAVLSSAINLRTSQDAEIIGTKGRIIIPEFWRAQKIILQIESQQEEVMHFPHQYNGFEYEIESVNACIKEGKKESNIVPLQETLSVSMLIEQIYHECKYQY